MGSILGRRAAVVLMAFGLWIVGAIPVSADDVAGPTSTAVSGSMSLSTPMAQTFKLTAAGILDVVKLKIDAGKSGPVKGTVEIQTVSGGVPSGTILGSSPISGLSGICCGQWFSFSFNPAVSLAAGEYAIVIEFAPNDVGKLTWYYGGGVIYTDGQLYQMLSTGWKADATKDFTFQTWMLNGASQPFSVSVTNPSVAVDEMSTAHNSGSYYEPNGYSVALSASEGTLTRTGTSSGTWSWSEVPDEGLTQSRSVTITANDGHSNVVTGTFSLTVTSVPPKVSISGAPSSGPEGKAITLTAHGASDNPADNAGKFTYAWKATKNGAAFGSDGTGPTFSLTPDDEGSFTVTVTASDDGGQSNTAQVTVAGDNAPPQAVITSVTHDLIVLVPAQTVTFVGGFTDPGTLDQHTSTLDWGDNTSPDTYTYDAGVTGDVTDTHAYAQARTYTISYTVRDDDGGTSTATYALKVETPADALVDISGYVTNKAVLGNGDRNSLQAKYRAAQASLARGDLNSACGQLGAVLNDLDQMTKNGKLSQADSGALASATWAVHIALGCTKVKVGWLTLSL